MTQTGSTGTGVLLGVRGAAGVARCASPAKTRTRRPRTPFVLAYLLSAWVLITLNFALPRALPGNPLDALADPSAPTYVQDSATRDALAAYYGLDRPLVSQYAHYLAGLARGDVGTSIRYNAPVSTLIRERLPWTVLLVVTAMTAATFAGVAAGTHSAWRRGRAVDRGLLAAFLGVRNLPVYFTGSMALFVFAVRLGWLPLAGARTAFMAPSGLLGTTGDVARHLVLPAGVLALQFAAGHFLLMRASMVTQLGADYLLLGRAKGVRERRLKYAYAARNAIPPVVTLIALQLGFAVTGSIFVETIFAWPGMGRLLFDAVVGRDYPTLQGCFLVLTLTVLTANLAADLLARRLDPRVAA